MQLGDNPRSARLETAIDWFFLVADGRALLVTGMYWIAFAMLDAVSWKIATACLIIYVLQVAAVGRRTIEKLGLMFLVAAMVYWVDIVPLHEWSGAARQRISDLLSGR